MSERKSVSIFGTSPSPSSRSLQDKSLEHGDTRIELEEDEYLERMTRIIERDFYPLTRSLRNQADQSLAGTPQSQLTAGDFRRTPGTYSSITNRSQFTHDRDNLSLDEFFSKYNSEDNKSFDKLQIETKMRHIQKYPWMYLKNEPHNKKTESQFESLAIEQQDKKNGPSCQPISWKHDPKNALYNLNDLDTVQKGGDKRASTINHQSTRLSDSHLFKKPASVDPVQHTKHSVLTNTIGTDGTFLCAGETPQVGGYAFVPATPPFASASTSRDDATTGASTSDSSLIRPDTPQFRVADMSTRDRLVHKLIEKARKSRCDTPMKQEKYSPYSTRSVGSMMSIFSPVSKSLSQKKS